MTIDPQSGKLIEPSFWGENQTTPNIPLANFYLAKLKSLLSYFNSGEIAESEQNILEAYHEGQAQLNQDENARDFWYCRPQSK